MKKSILLLFVTLALFNACKDDDSDENAYPIGDLVGEWRADFYGYDTKMGSTVYITRVLTIKSDKTYQNDYYGSNSSAGSTNPLWETETGSMSLTETTVTWNPSSAQLINFSTQGLETYNKASWTENIDIQDGVWQCNDMNLNVTYALQKQ